MIKKLIFVVLVVALLLSQCAYADDCEHYFRFLEYTESGEYSISSTQHEHRQYLREVCVYCGLITSAYYKFSPESHRFVQSGHDWHIEGENVHHYRVVCEACGHTSQITMNCNGADCNKNSVMPK